MANRVTVAEVQEIMDTGSLTDAQVTAFITAANLTVTDKLGGSTALSAAQLKEIERWLSAHFVAMRERQVADEKIGEASVKYGGQFGKMLDFTQYGQQVKILDTTGTLANIGKRKATFEVIDILDEDNAT